MKYIIALFLLTGICFSQELERQQRESLLADIAKLNVQIAQTDSLTKAEQKFNAEQAARQQADIKRRKSEIEDLNKKLAELNAEMKREKNSISNAQTKAESSACLRL